MYIANMETETMTWIGLGETEIEAKEAIRNKWNEHQRKLVQSGWKNEEEIAGNLKVLEGWYDIDIIELGVGECTFR